MYSYTISPSLPSMDTAETCASGSLSSSSWNWCRRLVLLEVQADCVSGGCWWGSEDPYPGAVRAKPAAITMIVDVIRDDCGCEAAAPRSLGPFWLWMRHRMCFQGLGPGEQGPPARSSETHLSSGRQGQDSMVTDAVGDACRNALLQSTTITWSFCFLCQVIWCYLASYSHVAQHGHSELFS